MRICPACGIDCDADHKRIAELESQVRILTEKASAAVDRVADYEDEIRRLRSTTAEYPEDSELAPSPPPSEPAAATTTAFPSRFATLMGSRKASPTPTNNTDNRPSSSSSTSRRESDLAAALAREHELRQKAEGQVSQMSIEIEDLSVNLFQQANEMVVTERKARAKLEERVEVLELRDLEKRKRLERLEGALKRIERVRGLLSP